MIYKTRDDALQQPEPQQQAAEMDPETEAAWNRWFDARVLDHLKIFDEETVCEDVRVLRKQIDQLRSEVENTAHSY